MTTFSVKLGKVKAVVLREGKFAGSPEIADRASELLEDFVRAAFSKLQKQAAAKNQNWCKKDRFTHIFYAATMCPLAYGALISVENEV